MGIIFQKLRKNVPSDLDKAIKYYSILSILNDLKLTDKQVEMLAFTSVRGTITPLSARREFVELFDSSMASVENIKGKLAKKGWLIEVDRKYKVNPRFNLDFSRDITLQINLQGYENNTK